MKMYLTKKCEIVCDEMYKKTVIDVAEKNGNKRTIFDFNVGGWIYLAFIIMCVMFSLFLIYHSVSGGEMTSGIQIGMMAVIVVTGVLCSRKTDLLLNKRAKKSEAKERSEYSNMLPKVSSSVLENNGIRTERQIDCMKQECIDFLNSGDEIKRITREMTFAVLIAGIFPIVVTKFCELEGAE